jgi:hypothetical protein
MYMKVTYHLYYRVEIISIHNKNYSIVWKCYYEWKRNSVLILFSQHSLIIEFVIRNVWFHIYF